MRKKNALNAFQHFETIKKNFNQDLLNHTRMYEYLDLLRVRNVTRGSIHTKIKWNDNRTEN